MRDLDPWQFRLLRQQSPSGARAIGSYTLECGSGIGCVELRDAADQKIGLMLGFPIDLQNECWITEPHHFDISASIGADAFANQAMTKLGGRFLLLIEIGGELTIYPDASAQIPCVYCPETKAIGSTAYALFDEGAYQERFDQELHRALDVGGEGWFPAGLTAHRGLFRLLPNHCLDTSTWTVRRFWPLGDLETTSDPVADVAEIIAIVRAQLTALSKGPRKAAQGLTAGRDTRMLLGCARPFIEDTTFITITGGDRHATDTIMARRIASEEHLTHRELPRVTATKEEQAVYLHRGGHCVADANVLYHPTVWPLADSHILAGGAVGETGRAFFWRDSDSASTEVSPERLADRMGIRREDIVVEALAAWMKSLPLTDTLLMFDLAYLEHRMGGWYAAQAYCDPTMIRIAPLATRRTVELMLSLPQDWKRASRLCDEIVRQTWPELERYPYNSLGKWRDGYMRAVSSWARIRQDPGVIAKKLRKLRR